MYGCVVEVGEGISCSAGFAGTPASKPRAIILMMMIFGGNGGLATLPMVLPGCTQMSRTSNTTVCPGLGECGRRCDGECCCGGRRTLTLLDMGASFLKEG